VAGYCPDAAARLSNELGRGRHQNGAAHPQVLGVCCSHHGPPTHGPLLVTGALQQRTNQEMQGLPAPLSFLRCRDVQNG